MGDSWEQQTIERGTPRIGLAARSTPHPILVPVRQSRGRVLVADDDVLLREGVASLLSGNGFDVVGWCGEPKGAAVVDPAVV